MSGLWAGILLLILVAILTDKSLRMLIEQASFHPKLRHLPIHTFEDLASYPYGKLGSGFVLLMMFIMAYGAMVAYLLIIKDTVPTVLGFPHGENLLERNLILLVTSLGIMVPLSMQRDMASLSCTSAISVIADLILVGFIAGKSVLVLFYYMNSCTEYTCTNRSFNRLSFIIINRKTRIFQHMHRLKKM